MCVLEHVVGSANRVEGRATWNGHLVRSGPDFTEERLMLFFSKASLTVLKPILVQEFLSLNFKLDVQKRVFNCNDEKFWVLFHLCL